MGALFNLVRARRLRARAPRVEMFIEASLAGPRQPRHAIALSDLSPRGFRAEGPVKLTPGDEIHVEFPGLGEVASRVVWARGCAFGVEFIGPADLRRLFVAGLAAPHASHMREAA